MEMEVLGRFGYTEEQRERWRKGKLSYEWYEIYPFIFGRQLGLAMLQFQLSFHDIINSGELQHCKPDPEDILRELQPQ
jgi:hypothetical protein